MVESVNPPTGEPSEDAANPAGEEASSSEPSPKPDNVISIEEAKKGANHWYYRLYTRMDTKGVSRPFPCEDNVVIVLEGSSTLRGLFRYNEMSGQIEVSRRPPWDSGQGRNYPRNVQDVDIAMLRSKLGLSVDSKEPRSYGTGMTFGLDHVEAGVDNVASDKHAYHPVKEYLSALKWDGKARIDTFLEEHFEADPTPVCRMMWRKFLVNAVRRVYEPGCKVDTMLILGGAQDIGKSTILQVLFGKYHSDRFPNIESDYAPMALEGQWCVEASELAAFQRATMQEPIKMFLTATHDKYKKPYKQFLTENPRQCVFAGTTNVKQFLNDPTGERRYWPIWLNRTKRLTLEEVALFNEVRDQLWAEAMVMYQAGENPRIEGDDLRNELARLHEEAKLDDPLAQKCRDILLSKGMPKEVRTEVMLDWLGFLPADYSRAKVQVGKAMRALGWELRLVRPKGGKNTDRYYAYMQPLDWMTKKPEAPSI